MGHVLSFKKKKNNKIYYEKTNAFLNNLKKYIYTQKYIKL